MRSHADEMARVVAGAKNGSENDFRALYREFSPKARGTLRHMVGPSHLDDLVQEVFVRVWKGLPKMKNETAFSTWFYRITWNVAMDARSQAAAQRTHEIGIEKIESERGIGTREHASPESTVNVRVLIEQALKHLTKEQCDVLVLSDFEELPTDEIAAIVGAPAGTVKSRLFHARSLVRDYLKTRGVSP